jgi:hypothetical protein
LKKEAFMSTVILNREAPCETEVEMAEFEFTETKAADKHRAGLALAAETRIGNMTVNQLTGFVESAQKSEGRPYRDIPTAEEMRFHLKTLRAEAVKAMQVVVDQELRLRAQVWHVRLVRALKSSDLLVPLGASATVALFWTIWYLVTGHVPVTESIAWTKTTAIALPFAMTRWLDVPCAFVAVRILATSFRTANSLNSDKKELLAVGLGLGLVAGLVGGLAIGISTVPLGGFAGEPIRMLIPTTIGVLFGRASGGLATGLVSGLVVGLTIGLLVGLAVGLAPMLPVWLPITLALLWLTRHLLKKQRGW